MSNRLNILAGPPTPETGCRTWPAVLSVIPDGLGHTVRSRVASVCRRYANFWRGASLSLRLIRGARDGCDRRYGALAAAARASAQRRRRLSSHNRPLITLTESP